jgi:hypothetical protein
MDEDFVEDDSGVFINTNVAELQRYKQARAQLYQNKILQERVDKLEKEIVQIKQILQKHLVG